MKYEKLSKLYYKYEDVPYENELDKRTNGYGSYVTPLKINGFRKGATTNDIFTLFYVNVHELMMLNNEVLKNSSKISLLINKLPEFVIEPYFKKLIVNEAQSNNEIEGVRSTKKELKEAINDLKEVDSKKKKFTGLMKTYQYIDKIEPFDNVEDFRKLYDDLVSDEIIEEDKPDGKFFRKGLAQVNDGSVTTHIGLSSEEKITEALVNLINYLKDESHPELYRFMVAHYYYEYIHPFYDGNGRTGRLIVGSYLSRYLDRYSAITFSYAVNKDKSKYYKAIEEIALPLNKGDMTFYLIAMLELISNGQKSIIEDLEINLMKYRKIEKYFENDEWRNYGHERNFLCFMASISVFVDDGLIFSIKDLMDISRESRHIVSTTMNSLLRRGCVEVVNKRPKTYRVLDKCIDDILFI